MSETVKTKVGSDLILASVELSAEGEVHDAALSMDSMSKISLQPRLLGASTGHQNFSHVFDDLDVRKSGAISRADSVNVAAGMDPVTVDLSSPKAKSSGKASSAPLAPDELRQAIQADGAFGGKAVDKLKPTGSARIIIVPRVQTAISLGTKKKQEDRLFVGERFEVGHEAFVLYAVFDGHGGEVAAEFCRTHVQGVLQELGSSAKDMHQALHQTFYAMDAQLREMAVKGGTTATLALINLSLGRAFVANVGDSSAFVVTHDGEEAALTVDHNTGNMEEVQRVRANGGYVSDKERYPIVFPSGPKSGEAMPKPLIRQFGLQYDALAMQLKVTRALGDFAFKEDPPEVEGDAWDEARLKTGVIVEPHLSKDIAIDRRMAIILASDGLWDYEKDAGISVTRQVREAMGADGESIKPYGEPMKVAESLVAAAEEAQTNDNICCIVIIFDPL